MKSHDNQEGLRVVPTKTEQPFEHKVAAILLIALRETEQRATLKEQLEAGDGEIEAALLSETVRQEFELAKTAFLMEQAPSLLSGLVAGAKNREGWAWKILFDSIGLTELLRATLPQAAAEEDNSIISPGFDRDLLENIREIMSGKHLEHAQPDPANRPDGE